MTEPTSGEIEIFGKKVVFGDNSIIDHIGFLPDVPGFYDWMTAKEFLEFCGSLFHIKKETLDLRIKDLLILVGLSKSANKKVRGFSRGMKQRLGIAQALINDPKIILLDEPVSALDPMGRKEVMDIIGSLAGKVTVFFSTHILADVERICDRVIIIKDGVSLLEDSIENIKSMSSERKIEIDFENDDVEQFKKLIQDLSWVVSLSNGGKKLLLSVNDLNKARSEIIKMLAAHDMVIKHVIFKEPTLEDIFIQVVNEHD